MNKKWPYSKYKYSGRKRKTAKALTLPQDVKSRETEVKSTMSIFIALLRESVLVQGLITVAFVLTTCYLWATGQPVPNELWTANTIVLGFFFGAKIQQSVSAYRHTLGG